LGQVISTVMLGHVPSGQGHLAHEPPFTLSQRLGYLRFAQFTAAKKGRNARGVQKSLEEHSPDFCEALLWTCVACVMVHDDALCQTSKRECELAEIPVRGVRSALNRHEKMLRRIARASFVLDEKQVLELQK